MEVSQLGKALVAFFNVLERYGRQSLYPKVFYGKRRDYRTIDNGAPDTLLTVITGTRQLAHESTGKGVPRARRIEDFFEWVGRRRKDG